MAGVTDRISRHDNRFTITRSLSSGTMKLRTKLALGLLALTVILSVATYGGFEYYKGQQVADAEADVNETAMNAARQVAADLTQKRDDLAFVAGQLDGDALASDQGLVGPYISQSRFFAAYVVDTNGTIVRALGPFNESEEAALVGTPADIECVDRTLATGDGCVSDLRTPEGSVPYVVMTAPVFDDGEVTGVVAAPIYADSEAFFSSLSTLASGDQSVRVVHGDRTLFQAGQNFRADVAATAQVPGHELRVVVERDRSALAAELQGLALAQGLGIVVVLLAVVGFGYWEYSVNLSQTERLLEGFRAIEGGRYDYQLDVGASEEWEQIRDGFTTLAAGLAAREEALRDREQRLGVLNRVMRHNVRNEMNVVLSYVQMLGENVDPPYDGMATTAGEAGRRLVALAGKAGLVERTLAGENSTTRPVDLAAAVREAGRDVTATYPDVSFYGDLPKTCWVRGVPGISEAVHELLTNACKHNDADDPWLEVVLEEAVDGVVHLRVLDNGPGIAEHERGAIEMGAETALVHASGLGLWLVYWVVDRCGGEVTFDERQDGGAIVDCTFYTVDPEAVQSVTERESDAQRTAEKGPAE